MSREKEKAERRELEAAGWKPIKRMGEVVWRRPNSRFLYPKSMALRLIREAAEEAGGDDEGAA